MGDQNADKKDIGDLIEKFEFYKQSTPSVILMKIDHGLDEDTSAVKPYIVGGYASHGWLVSGGMGSGGNGGSGKGGDNTCFLFNLTLNLRFNARPDLDYYQFSSKEELRFGNSDLVIKDGFNSVTSKISVPAAV